MKIAIVGTGIAGNVAAYHLAREHEITVFEADRRIGGHTNTLDVKLAGQTYAVDTGFIVFNERTYPNFISLIDELGVGWQDSDMSFSVQHEGTGLEYKGSTLNSLFAQRSNLFRPSFYRMIREILRFNHEARELLEFGHAELSLDAFLADNGYSREFVDYFIIPMGAAIWSAKPEVMGRMPARFFVRFFHNHGMLSVNDRPVWRVIKGGSKNYLDKLVAGHRDRIRLNTPVEYIRRLPGHVEVKARGFEPEHFDHVFMACHADQALQLLADPTLKEKSVLGRFKYQPNEAVLHTDHRLMPRRRMAWAAWNYHIPVQEQERVALTYNMNILQGIQAPETFCVTLNYTHAIDAEKIIEAIQYSHPVFTPEAVAAQKHHADVNGERRTFFCGAYWRNGFHEDGVVSALSALEHFQMGPNMISAIYEGQVRHRRMRPAGHEFTYRLFMMYLDLDELDSVFSHRWFWSARRPALARFKREDHLGDPNVPLDRAVRALVAEQTGRIPKGPIRLLTHLNYFGYGFNPVSFYYCYDKTGEVVETIVAEVNNTPWGEQYCYVLCDSADIGKGGQKRYQPAKKMHVSPFMEMDINYDWRFSPPAEHLNVHMENTRKGEKIFDATLEFRRAEITASSLARVLIAYPLMTARIILAIHWQALRLWMKRVPVYDHPDKHMDMERKEA